MTEFDPVRFLEELKASLAKSAATCQRLIDDPNTTTALRKKCERLLASYRRHGALAEKLYRK